MVDNIIMKRIWQDADLFQVEVECRSNFVIARNKVYMTDIQLEDLYNKIHIFLLGKEDTVFWESGPRGNMTTPCISFSFSHKDCLGHIQIEVFMELDDGGSFSIHNCCFFLMTEFGLLHRFKDEILKFRSSQVGLWISLT